MAAALVFAVPAASASVAKASGPDTTTMQTPSGLDTNQIVGVQGTTTLVVSDADGSNTRTIAPALPAGTTAVFDPDLSPNGAEIAFVACTGASSCVPNQRYRAGRLYLVGSDGDGLTPLLGDQEVFGPRWSPDGARIAFATQAAGGSPSVWTVRADGTGMTQLATGADPSWSPDGARIAFDSGGDLFTVPSQGGAVTQLTHHGPGVGLFSSAMSDPTWSPNGRYLAYVEAGFEYLSSIGIMTVTGSAPVAGFSLVGASSLSWSPDSSRILAQGTDRSGIFSLDGALESPDPVEADPSWIRVTTSAGTCQGGYHLAAADGGIFSYGHAGFHGSMGGQPLNQPIVGMATDTSTGGYWLVAADGGIFSFDAPFLGSMGGQPLNQPIVGMAATPDAGGYWLVASDGGIFAFGDAAFHGSHGGSPLNQPVTGMASTQDGEGYWLVATDGGIFSYGDAPYYGNGIGSLAPPEVVGISRSTSGDGYLLAGSDGSALARGDEQFCGAPATLNAPVVAAAS